MYKIGGGTLILNFQIICWSTEYIRVSTAITPVPLPFSIFCATLCLSIQQLCTLNKVYCLADGDVSKVTWLQEIMAHLLNLNAASAVQSQRT